LEFLEKWVPGSSGQTSFKFILAAAQFFLFDRKGAGSVGDFVGKPTKTVKDLQSLPSRSGKQEHREIETGFFLEWSVLGIQSASLFMV
jgi:hypothetical protein